MAVPDNSDFIANTVTENQFKSNFLILLDHIRQITIDTVKFDRITDSDTENLVEFHDKNGNVVLALNKKGQLTSVDEDMKRSILLTNQEDIKEIFSRLDVFDQHKLGFIANLISFEENNSNIQEWRDAEDNVLLELTKNGVLRSAQLDQLRFDIGLFEYVSQIVKQSNNSNLWNFEDANGTLLGYVDKFNNWILNGVNVLNEINDLKRFKSKASAVTPLKELAFQHPTSIIQIYLTDLPPIPNAKGVVVSGLGEVHIDGQSFNSYVNVEVQGSSSAAYAKKNLTIGFFSDKARTESLNIKIADLIPHDELVFKSNWIDHTNLRNAGAYRIWESITATRSAYPRLETEIALIGKTGVDALQTGATGVPRLYPAVIYVNDEFYGIGSFGIGKKRANYNIAKNKPTEILIGWEAWNDLTNLDVTVTDKYEFKAPSNPTNQTYNCIRAWNTFASSSKEDFALNAKDHLVKDNIVDFYIFLELLYCDDLVRDNLVYNFLFSSYNGKQFLFMPYDLDTVFGLHWSGSSVVDNTNLSLLSNDKFFSKVKYTYLSDIQARYTELRNLGVISKSNVYNIATDLSSKYSPKINRTELNKWQNRPSLNITSLEQIISWTEKRIAFLDNHFNYTA